MSFTAGDLEEAVRHHKDVYGSNGFMDLFYGERDSIDTPYGKVTVVEKEYADGDGGHIHVVVTVEGTNRLFKVDGRYSSWDGSELDGDLYEVEAYPVAVTRYRKV